MTWFGFWILLAVFVSCDTRDFMEGYDSFFQTHKTAQEIELQKLKIEETELRIQLLKKRT